MKYKKSTGIDIPGGFFERGINNNTYLQSLITLKIYPLQRNAWMKEHNKSSYNWGGGDTVKTQAQ